MNGLPVEKLRPRAGDDARGSATSGGRPPPVEISQSLEQRVLILAPLGRDAELMARMLASYVAASCCCRDLVSLAHEVERGAAAVLLTEEAYTDHANRLDEMLASQPPWSDLPVLLLTAHGADSIVAMRATERLGNVTLLERPVRVPALVSAVRSALRARARQYETRRYLEERELAGRRKDQFLATLAHELRNPLAPIRNSLDVMRLTGAEIPTAPQLAILDRQVNQLVRLVDDLMDVSRITRGKIDLRRERMDLAAMLAVAIETSRPLIESARHTLEVAMPPEKIALHGDAMRLAQVFANLLNNAARYTDPGGRITLRAWRDGREAVVEICDTGVGMAPEALSNVFEMFAQADAQDSRARTGLGIGLTLAKSLVEMHDGSVTASSEGPGCGSQFVVRLPVADHERASGAVPATRATGVREAMRILVVDDNQDAADTLTTLLRLLGAEVRVVYDGQSALELVETFAPSVVVLDLGMPVMDGYEVASRIRQRPDGARFTLIALSGWGQEKDRERTKAIGFDHHLVKPVGLEDMQAVLAKL